MVSPIAIGKPDCMERQGGPRFKSEHVILRRNVLAISSLLFMNCEEQALIEVFQALYNFAKYLDKRCELLQTQLNANSADVSLPAHREAETMD